MKITSLVTALHAAANTGWGTAGPKITEELKKLAFVQDLNQVNDGLILKQDFPVCFNVPVLQAIRGVDLLPMYPQLQSSWRVGLSFAEDNLLLRRYGLNAAHWDRIVVGSTWAKEQMEIAAPDANVTVAIQGVDTEVFKPIPPEEVGYDGNWFTIFSGGKFELRKSNDIVIRAVSVMMERHKDVRLVASWWNPWLASVNTMAASKLIDFPIQAFWSDEFLLRYLATTKALPTDRVTLLKQCDHTEMARQMNRCDVGLFPNRCEAGTNLVLMEAMACGLPVIATVNHGHNDVTKHLHPVPFGPRDWTRIPSKPFTVGRGGMAVAEWFEPDLDATIEALECAYVRWQIGDIDTIGKPNITAMKQYTWAACSQKLLEACE